MAKSLSPVRPGGIGVDRQKFWKGLNQSEKIERMREVIKRLQDTLSTYHERARRMEQHTHNEKGEAIEVKKFGYMGGSEQAAKMPEVGKDEVYF